MPRAQFIAVIQVTVYAGAIMVLFLFVIIMLLILAMTEVKMEVDFRKTIACILCLVMLAEISYFIVNFVPGSWHISEGGVYGNSGVHRKISFTSYPFSF